MARRPPSTALAFQDDAALLKPGPVRDRLLSQMRRQGARDVRLNVIWGRTKAEGFGAYDDAVRAIRAHGLRPQMTLMATPRYSPQWDQGLAYNRNDPKLWQQFARDVAKRYRGQVGRYSIGNEPNHPAFLAGSDKNPKRAGRTYRNVYRAGYAGIKQADRGAQVMLGEVTNQKGARQFLQGVFAGKPLKTAGFAYHPYASPGSDAWDLNNLGDLQATLGRYKRQGRLQTAAGQAAPLYLTEFGIQRGSMSEPDRLRAFAHGYAKARQAGARQMLLYQLMPSQRPTVTTPGRTVADGYGNLSSTPGSTRPADDWVWDTSIGDAAGNIPVINRGIRLPAARTARARTARRR